MEVRSSIKYVYSVRSLPREMVLEIFSYLEILDLFACQVVCRSWLILAMHESFLYRKLCYLRWGVNYVSRISFQEYYRISAALDGFTDFNEYATQVLRDIQILAKTRKSNDPWQPPIPYITIKVKQYEQQSNVKKDPVSPPPKPAEPKRPTIQQQTKPIPRPPIKTTMSDPTNPASPMYQSRNTMPTSNTVLLPSVHTSDPASFNYVSSNRTNRRVTVNEPGHSKMESCCIM